MRNRKRWSFIQLAVELLFYCSIDVGLQELYVMHEVCLRVFVAEYLECMFFEGVNTGRNHFFASGR